MAARRFARPDLTVRAIATSMPGSGSWRRTRASSGRSRLDPRRCSPLGVPDGRPASLPETLQRLVATDSWWELVGPDDRAASDGARERLRGLGAWVAARARALDESGIAATIQHDDLHGGNVFVGPAGIRFFDWGDSVVAHPFASMVTTLNSVAYRLGIEADDPLLARLRDAYLDAWTDVLPRAALAEVLAIALDLGRIGKAAAWARALDGLDPSDMDGHGDAPALWLLDLVERWTRGKRGTSARPTSLPWPGWPAWTARTADRATGRRTGSAASR